MVPPVLWVGYTPTGAGSARFRRRALRLASERSRSAPHELRLAQLVGKRDFLAEMAKIAPGALLELHLVAHGGTYGPLFGSRHWPEQLSRHEWSEARLPFAPGARAYFHSARSGRWFAPFFADRFGVEAYGYASRVSCSRLLRYTPRPPATQGYDPVARLYDAAFQDIRVRADEWRWLERRLRASSPLSVLDLGCGNGALLCQLAPRLKQGIGLDASAELIGLARLNGALRGAGDRLRFEVVTSPRLPIADRSVDRVVSLLSFRYLDWDPIVEEVRRVLEPGGRWLVVDMVASRCAPWQAPALLRGKWTSLRAARRAAGYRPALERLVRDPGWQRMLEHNPMRTEREFSCYLQSRFPGGSLEVINVALASKVLAFDSGPIGAAD